MVTIDSQVIACHTASLCTEIPNELIPDVAFNANNSGQKEKKQQHKKELKTTKLSSFRHD